MLARLGDLNRIAEERWVSCEVTGHVCIVIESLSCFRPSGWHLQSQRRGSHENEGVVCVCVVLSGILS